MTPPLPITRHLKSGASPQVAPGYLSRRGVDWFKRGLGRVSAWEGEHSLTAGFRPLSQKGASPSWPSASACEPA